MTDSGSELVPAGDGPTGDDDPGDQAGIGDEGLGGLDFGSMLEAAQGLMGAQADLGEKLVVGQSGGGVVRVEVTGAGDYQSVTIDPAAVDPADVEMLQDLVLAALRDANERIADLHREAQEGALGGLDLGGLLGGGGD